MARQLIYPGEILSDELAELSLTASALARRIKVPPNRISQIIQGKRAITGDTALRLAETEAGKEARKLPTRAE